MTPARFREIRAIATLLLLVACASLLGHLIGSALQARPIMVVLCDVRSEHQVTCTGPTTVKVRR